MGVCVLEMEGGRGGGAGCTVERRLPCALGKELFAAGVLPLLCQGLQAFAPPAPPCALPLLLLLLLSVCLCLQAIAGGLGGDDSSLAMLGAGGRASGGPSSPCIGGADANLGGHAGGGARLIRRAQVGEVGRPSSGCAHRGGRRGCLQRRCCPSGRAAARNGCAWQACSKQARRQRHNSLLNPPPHTP